MILLMWKKRLKLQDLLSVDSDHLQIIAPRKLISLDMILVFFYYSTTLLPVILTICNMFSKRCYNLGWRRRWWYWLESRNHKGCRRWRSKSNLSCWPRLDFQDRPGEAAALSGAWVGLKNGSFDGYWGGGRRSCCGDCSGEDVEILSNIQHR